MATVRTDAYQLPLPAGWSDRTAVTIAAPAAADGSVPNLVITREALCAGMGLAGFADGHAQPDARPGRRLRVALERLGGARRASARWCGWSASPVADSAPLVQLQAFFVRDGLGYAICGTATEQAFPGGRAGLPRGARRPALRRSPEPARARSRCCAGERSQAVRRPPRDRRRPRALRARADRARRRRLPGAAAGSAAEADARVWGFPAPDITRHRAPGLRDRPRRRPAVRPRAPADGLADPGSRPCWCMILAGRTDGGLLPHVPAGLHLPRRRRDRRGGRALGARRSPRPAAPAAARTLAVTHPPARRRVRRREVLRLGRAAGAAHGRERVHRGAARPLARQRAPGGRRAHRHRRARLGPGRERRGHAAGRRSRACAAALNAHLPLDVAVLGCSEAPPGFHARFSARSRLYEYRVLRSRAPSPLRAARVWHWPRDVEHDVLERVRPDAARRARLPRLHARRDAAPGLPPHRAERRPGSGAETSSCSASRPTPSCGTWCARSPGRCCRPRPASARPESFARAARRRPARRRGHDGPAACALPGRRTL